MNTKVHFNSPSPPFGGEGRGEGEPDISHPHPNPRQLLHALLYLLHPWSRLPQERGDKFERSFKLLLSLLLLLLTPSAHADDIQMLGAGNVSCKEWKSLRDNNEYFSAGNWMLGFLSGTAWDSGRNILSGQQPKKLFVFVDNYCIASEKETISDAAVALAYHLLDNNRPE